MKYQVGDKIRIKPKVHFCSVDGFNNINMKDEFFNEYSRLPYCETVMTIGIVNKDFYILKEDKWAYKWTDEMIEGLVEKKISIKLTGEAIKNNEMVVSVDEYILPEGYIFKDENGNVINARKIVLEKKKKEYPKTYEECRDYIESCHVEPFCADIIATGYKSRLIESFARLLICRDAYWKIAGEEMGLGKPWEPGDNKVFGIIRQHGKIQKYNDFVGGSTILEFPTEEMRDAFKENFDPDIETCKEFL